MSEAPVISVILCDNFGPAMSDTEAKRLVERMFEEELVKARKEVFEKWLWARKDLTP